MSVTPQITVTVNLDSLLGIPNVNGTMTVELLGISDGIARVPGTCILVITKWSVTSDISGFCTITFYGNDVISPANTYYKITVTDSTETMSVFDFYQFSGTGTFDLTTLTPFVP